MTKLNKLTKLTKLNNSDARSSRKCPWAVDLENMVMPSARRRSAKPASGHLFLGKGEGQMLKRVSKERGASRYSAGRLLNRSKC